MLSCSTGTLPDGFAQNLSNKMNKEVIAPSDILWFGEKQGKRILKGIKLYRQLSKDKKF
jgi:hypothetical protein